MKLPAVRSDLRDFEKAAEISVDVLVRILGYGGIWIGRYIHGLGEWQVNGISGGPIPVMEWWPLPEPFTGETIGTTTGPEKFWQPVAELMVMPLDQNSEPMRDDPDLPQTYHCTVVGFDLDDPEGCRSILTVTGDGHREDDAAFATLLISGLQQGAS